MITFIAMLQNSPTRLLALASIISLLTLLCIQIYLVANTYKLYRNSFTQETRKQIGALTQLPELEELEDSIQENLKTAITRYTISRSSRETVFDDLKAANAETALLYGHRLNELLHQRNAVDSLTYSSRYDEIIVEWSGHLDTLLKTNDSPLVVIGTSWLPKDAILSNRNTWRVKLAQAEDTPGAPETELRITVQQSNYFLPLRGPTGVYQKMAGILLLASLLITAVVVLFYVVFHAMVKQKKLATMKTDFANNITHELKTPLSSVGVILKSMRKIDHQSQQDIMKELMGSMDRQYAKIQRLIDNVLESTISSDGPVLSPIEMPTFLHDFAKDLWLGDHKLRLEINPARCDVRSSEPSLMRILNILIDNAMKYSKAGSSIIIRAYSTQAAYSIEVSDNGPGIPHLYHELVFEKFYRVPGHDHFSVKGLGLGLFIARETAAQIKATLVMANGESQGCTLILKLPL